MRFIAHVTDAVLRVHRMVIDRPDKKAALRAAFASVKHSQAVSIRREESPQTVAGAFAATRPPTL